MVSAAPATLSLQEAADSLGVHYMTVYRYVRQGRLPATRQGTAWRVRPSDVTALQSVPASRARRGAARTGADRLGLERRMMAGDNAGAWWLVESQLGGGLDPSGILTELIVPALRAIGDGWAQGTVSVAEEHRATAVAQRVVGRLGFQFARRGKTRGTVALAAPAGDLHTLPVAIVADLLRWRGFDVVELGGNTPPDALGEAVAGEPRLVAVGIVATKDGLDDELASSVASVRAAVPDVPIFLGGASILSAAHVRRLGGDEWTGSGPTAAVDTVERLVGSPEGGAQRSVA
jgi:excisionase family DNA binding protein